jgi:hypothetical protein
MALATYVMYSCLLFTKIYVSPKASTTTHFHFSKKVLKSNINQKEAVRKALRWSYYSADFGGTETLSKFTQKKGRSIDDPIAEGTATTVQASFARRDTVNSRKKYSIEI